MKTIIVATDFSDNAQNALVYAAALAARTSSKIILFNAYQLPVHASNTLLPPQAYDAMIAYDKTRMDVIALAITGKFGVAVETYIKPGFVKEAFEEVVELFHPDLVVMGMHANDWGDRLFGNTTTSVIRRANYPVLIIPEAASFMGIDKILYACESNSACAADNLLLLEEFAKVFDAEVEVFHVDTPVKEGVQKKYVMVTEVEVALCEVDHFYKNVEDDDVIKGIAKGINDFSADLLVMVPHRLSFWEGVTNKSKTRMMALRTHLPLLILPETSRSN